MSDFIRKTELIENLNKLLEEYEDAMTTPSFFAALAAVRGAETVDVAPVVHGRWVKILGNWMDSKTRLPVNVHGCSVCGSTFQHAPYNYCPVCGAKMDKEVTEWKPGTNF